MKKGVLLSLGLTVALSACFPGNLYHPHLNAAEKIERKTVALVKWVRVDDEGKREEVDPNNIGTALADDLNLETYCAGVWITNDAFVTAAHCVDDIGEPASRQAARHALPDGVFDALFPHWNPVRQETTYSAFGDIYDTLDDKVMTTHNCQIMAFDEEHDLALVHALSDKDDPLPDHLIAPLATSARVGDPVDIMGHTVGMEWTYMKGWIGQIRSNYELMGETHNWIQVSAPVWYGNSGGGVFNSDGELLGIMSRIRTNKEGIPAAIGFAVPYFEVDALLTKEGFYDHR
jgi:hypothetical protein